VAQVRHAAHIQEPRRLHPVCEHWQVVLGIQSGGYKARLDKRFKEEMKMIRMLQTLALPVLVTVFGVLIMTSNASAQESANGHGTLLVQNSEGKTVRRQFSLSARRGADGSVKGQAILHNPAFDGPNGHGNYQLQINITCMKKIGNVVFFGGTTRRTNDPTLVDAVYFSVQDNGEPGKDRDKISRAFFFDDNPNTTGDPQLCQGNVLGDLPLETIESGNIQVRP
jgi:hypothetical protein